MRMKKSFTILIIGFLVMSIFTSFISSTGGSKTLYVQGPWATFVYENIQDAIDNASDGDIIMVGPGTYYENLIIDKTITLEGTGATSNMTIIDGGKNGNVIEVTADWVNISGFSIQNGGRKTDGVIYNYGILLLSNYANISNNVIENNIGTGIHFGFSNSNTISNNVIINNWNGINLGSSNSNTISSNSIDNSSLGIIIHNSSNNKIIGNTITNQGRGIELYDYNSYNEIKNNSINNNGFGIQAYGFNSNNDISNNIISHNNQNGIKITEMYGYSNNYTISGNTITDNGDWGIYLKFSTNNIISGNYIENNSLGGTYNNGIKLLNSSNYNTIFGNTFIKDWIELDDSDNNIFYNNNFISQHIQSYCWNCENTAWYNPKLGKGNYWNNYDGLDENDDGIGDTPHIVSSGDIQDNFPLMNPYGETFDIPSSNQDFKATVHANGINLTWDPPQDDGGIDIDGYEIYKGSDSGKLTLVTTVENNFYLDTDVTDGKTYYYQVTALNDVGVGQKSPEISAKFVDNEKNKDTPGFEIALLIFGLVIIFIYKKRNHD